MIDSIDNSMAAPFRDAEGSGFVSPETDALSETEVQTEPFPPLLGEDGGFAPDWYARFDELKGMEKSLSKFKTPEALAKSYAELERLRRYPGVENEEQMARFRRLAGLPESEKNIAWNVQNPRRKANGMLTWQNAWPARPIVTECRRRQ